MHRWLYHALVREDWERGADPYAPASFAREGFVHASFRDAVAESARLYLPADKARAVLRIDPRELGVAIEIAETPRGPMPHVVGAIRRDAVVEVIDLDAWDAAAMPDGIV
jgi:uncharacterized protein (DUF952 family)